MLKVPQIADGREPIHMTQYFDLEAMAYKAQLFYRRNLLNFAFG